MKITAILTIIISAFGILKKADAQALKNNTSAITHTVKGNEEEKLLVYTTIEKTEKYLNHTFSPLNITIENTHENYYKTICNIEGLPWETALKVSKTTIAFGFWNDNRIYIDTQGANRKEKEFYLCHELIHKYQASQNPTNLFKRRALLEGEADILASIITRYKLNIRNHKIPYDDLKDISKWQKYSSANILEQCRWEYLKRNTDLLTYLPPKTHIYPKLKDENEKNN